jgi:glycogen operon protein
MSEDVWQAGFVRCLGVRLAGDLIGDVDERGEPIVGDTIMLLLNAHDEAIPFILPLTRDNLPWECLLDTATPQGAPLPCAGGQPYELQGRSMVVLHTGIPQDHQQA